MVMKWLSKGEMLHFVTKKLKNYQKGIKKACFFHFIKKLFLIFNYKINSNFLS